jgi:hypothetical protein
VGTLGFTKPYFGVFMKKITMALVAVLVVTSSHAAFAGGSSIQAQRIAKSNYDYFKGQGVKDSGQPVAQNPDYKFQAKPEQRLAASNMEYFKDKPSSGATAVGANKADYVFNSKPEQRMAARSMPYYNQK